MVISSVENDISIESIKQENYENLIDFLEAKGICIHPPLDIKVAADTATRHIGVYYFKDVIVKTVYDVPIKDKLQIIPPNVPTAPSILEIKSWGDNAKKVCQGLSKLAQIDFG